LHARATRPHAGGVEVATPPVVEHVPPVADGPVSDALCAPMAVVGVHVEVTVNGDPTAPTHEPLRKNDITGPVQVTPVAAPQPQAEQVGAGAVRSALPSKTGVASNPAPQAGGVVLAGPT
jgi:hypothetical protein